MSIFAIDNNRPFIVRGNTQVIWGSGDMALKIASSRLLRIHARGITFTPFSWDFRASLREFESWKREDECMPVPDGLCVGKGDSGVYFPTSRPPLVNENLWNERCKSFNGNEDFGRSLTNEKVYEPSACDVLDAGYDFVYNGTSLYYREAKISPVLYWIICILVIFLVRCLSKYILFSMTKGDKSTNISLPNAWICMTVAIVTIVLVTYEGDSCFVTEEDLVFYWFVFTYSVFYAVLFWSVRIFRTIHPYFASFRDPPFYNLLSGVFQLVACRFYFSAITPYTLPILSVIAVRVLVKSRRRCADLVRAATLLLDGFMLSLLCVFSFGDAKEYLIALGCVTMAWADYLV